MQWGQGPGLTDRFQGEQGGEQSVTLIQTEMPVHTHTASGVAGNGSSNSPENNAWAQASIARQAQLIYGTTANTQMSPFATSFVGGNLPHNNMQPYLALNFCIAMQGVFPPRS